MPPATSERSLLSAEALDTAVLVTLSAASLRMRRVPSAAGIEACDKDGHATDYVNDPPSPSAALPSFLRPSMRLLPIETAPPHVRSEFVLYAYRPTSTSWRAAFLTLFRLHNETFNIWR